MLKGKENKINYHHGCNLQSFCQAYGTRNAFCLFSSFAFFFGLMEKELSSFTFFFVFFSFPFFSDSSHY